MSQIGEFSDTNFESFGILGKSIENISFEDFIYSKEFIH